MKKSEYNVLMKLVDFWEAIAERIENQPVDMTANTHRQVADKLKELLDKYRETDSAPCTD